MEKSEEAVASEEGVEEVSNTKDSVGSSSPDVETVKKRPPPESSESIRTRGLVILSFWAIVVLLGFPIWWWTTSIYRAQLPLHEMLEWADGRVSGRRKCTS